MGFLDKAINDFKKGLKEGSAEQAYQRGVAAEQIGLTDEAEARYRSAADKDHAGAMFSMGVLRSRQGRTDGNDGADAWFLRASYFGHPEAKEIVRQKRPNRHSPTVKPERVSRQTSGPEVAYTADEAAVRQFIDACADSRDLMGVAFDTMAKPNYTAVTYSALLCWSMSQQLLEAASGPERGVANYERVTDRALELLMDDEFSMACYGRNPAYSRFVAEWWQLAGSGPGYVSPEHLQQPSDSDSTGCLLLGITALVRAYCQVNRHGELGLKQYVPTAVKEIRRRFPQ